MDLTAKCSTPCFKNFYWYLINTGDLFLFKFSVVISNAKALGSGTSGSAMRIVFA